jgi:hypothetical protein
MSKRKIASEGEDSPYEPEASASKQKKKRQRTDVFSSLNAEEISTRVNKIIGGTHEMYTLDKQAQIKKDAIGNDQACWAVRSKRTHDRVQNLWSADGYRSFYVWWIHSKDGKAKDDLLALLKKVDRKSKDKYHHAHRCGNDWCVNPEHIRIISRRENEVDKHFHYFLNDSQTRDAFIATFRNKIAERHVW